MRKHLELSDPKSCMSRAGHDEITFVLLARDAASPVAIRAWIAERLRLEKNLPTDPQIVEAENCAAMMEQERDSSKLLFSPATEAEAAEWESKTAAAMAPAAPEGETPETDAVFYGMNPEHSEGDWFVTMTRHARSLERRLRAGGRDEGEAAAWMKPDGSDAVTKAVIDDAVAGGARFAHNIVEYSVPLYSRPVAPAITEKVREALEPFAKIADMAEKYGHQPGSTAEWRIGFTELVNAREALALLAPSTTTGEAIDG